MVRWTSVNDFFQLWLSKQLKIYFFKLWLGGQMQIYFFKQ